MRLFDRPDVKSLGVRVTLMSGRVLPRPIPSSVLQNLEDVEVVDTDEGRSGFQLTFRLSREGPRDALDYAPFRRKLFEPFHRISIGAWLGFQPKALMEGVVTRIDHDPVQKRLTVTGEDLTCLMDQEERSVAHAGMTPEIMVRMILLRYQTHRIIADVQKPRSNGLPLRPPQQHETDLRFLERIAEENGFLFYLEPGRLPSTTTAYWGPPKRTSRPQPAIKVDLNGVSNVESISFGTDPTPAAKVKGAVLDPQTGLTVDIRTFRSLRTPLSLDGLLRSPSGLKRHVPRGDPWTKELVRAQATTDRLSDGIVIANGELDCTVYGGILRARGTVGIQGAGYAHDGDYYVKRVTHRISQGAYTQSFTLSRDGFGALRPVVRT